MSNELLMITLNKTQSGPSLAKMFPEPAPPTPNPGPCEPDIICSC